MINGRTSHRSSCCLNIFLQQMFEMVLNILSVSDQKPLFGSIFRYEQWTTAGCYRAAEQSLRMNEGNRTQQKATEERRAKIKKLLDAEDKQYAKEIAGKNKNGHNILTPPKVSDIVLMTHMIEFVWLFRIEQAQSTASVCQHIEKH